MLHVCNIRKGLKNSSYEVSRFHIFRSVLEKRKRNEEGLPQALIEPSRSLRLISRIKRKLLLVLPTRSNFQSKSESRKRVFPITRKSCRYKLRIFTYIFHRPLHIDIWKILRFVGNPAVQITRNKWICFSKKFQLSTIHISSSRNHIQSAFKVTRIKKVKQHLEFSYNFIVSQNNSFFTSYLKEFTKIVQIYDGHSKHFFFRCRMLL